MKQGYLGIFRKFFDHEFWKEKRQYSKAEAWIDLMQCARYGEKPENLLDKRGAYVLEYGDVYISSRYLGERWIWSRTKVSKFLEYLEKRESITYKKKDSHRTIINITNLKSYTDWIQGIREEKASDQSSEEPVESQSSDSEKPKKKKVKKDNKEKNKTLWILPEGIKPEVWQEYEDHRKTTKTKLTDAARTKNANVLLKNLSDQQEIIDTAIGSGWTGLFPLKKGKVFKSRTEKNTEAKEAFLNSANQERDITPITEGIE